MLFPPCSQLLYYQHPTFRGGKTRNPKYEIAGGWTSMYHDGTCLTAKPYDVCKAIGYAIANMPKYSGIEITLVDGPTESIVTLEELKSAGVVMLPPPQPRREVRAEDELTALRAEVAALRAAAAERR